jgi:AcrR family transcriptional regulator
MGARAHTGPRRRGRPPDRSGDETRAEILAAAQRLFGAASYRDVSMGALAAACGLNQRALYYYFPSKRELFDAATTDALARFGAEVADRVLSRTTLRERTDGYIDVYRHLYETEPHLLRFIGMVLVDALADPAQAAKGGQAEVGAALNGFLETVVDDAITRREVHTDVDRAGAVMVLRALGMGVALASIDDEGHFPAMLHIFERINDGTLYRSPP